MAAVYAFFVNDSRLSRRIRGNAAEVYASGVVVAANDAPLKIVRSPANHLAFVDGQPVLYGENFFNRLSIRDDLSKDDFVNIAQFFKDWLKLPSTLRPRTHLEIVQINFALDNFKG